MISMRRCLVLAAVLVMLAACSSGSAAHTLKGTMTIQNTDNVFSADQDICIGSNGYDDLTSDAQVKVTNEKGAVIGTSSLASGGHLDINSYCVWHFTVKDLPDARFYSVEVSHRGQVTNSAKDLAAAGWKVDLTLG